MCIPSEHRKLVLQCGRKGLARTDGNKARHWWPKFSGDSFAPQVAQLLVLQRTKQRMCSQCRSHGDADDNEGHNNKTMQAPQDTATHGSWGIDEEHSPSKGIDCCS